MQTVNITSATTTTLRSLSTSLTGNIKSMRFTNTSQSTAVRVILFLEDSSSNKFYISTVDLPGLTSLLLTEGLNYNTELYALKLTTDAGGLSTSAPLSVIIQ